MANWITHTRIADILIDKGLDVDIKGFCIGNIAPDCNIENEDWTAYIPPKEVTHFMSAKENKIATYIQMNLVFFFNVIAPLILCPKILYIPYNPKFRLLRAFCQRM